MYRHTIGRLIKIRWLIAVLMTGFFLLYFILSLSGEYSRRLYPSGRLTYDSYSSGLSIPDSAIWMPQLIEWTPHSKNGWGWVYAPLVMLDRFAWHRNMLMIRFQEQKSGLMETENTGIH